MTTEKEQKIKEIRKKINKEFSDEFQHFKEVDDFYDYDCRENDLQEFERDNIGIQLA